MKADNYVRDKFENILKRNVVGDYNSRTLREKEKRNRKINSYKIRDKSTFGQDIYLGEKDSKKDLKVYN